MLCVSIEEDYFTMVDEDQEEGTTEEQIIPRSLEQIQKHSKELLCFMTRIGLIPQGNKDFHRLVMIKNVLQAQSEMRAILKEHTVKLKSQK